MRVRNPSGQRLLQPKAIGAGHGGNEADGNPLGSSWKPAVLLPHQGLAGITEVLFTLALTVIGWGPVAFHDPPGGVQGIDGAHPHGESHRFQQGIDDSNLEVEPRLANGKPASWGTRTTRGRGALGGCSRSAGRLPGWPIQGARPTCRAGQAWKQQDGQRGCRHQPVRTAGSGSQQDGRTGPESDRGVRCDWQECPSCLDRVARIERRRISPRPTRSRTSSAIAMHGPAVFGPEYA